MNDKVGDDSPTSSPPLDPIFTSNMQILPCSQVILIKVYVLRITICREGVELIEDQEDGTTKTFTFSGVTTSLVHLSQTFPNQVNVFWLGSSLDNPDIPDGPTPR